MNRRRLAILAAVAVLVLLFGGRWLALRFTEHAWYASLGQSERFWARLTRAVGWQALAVLAFSAWYGAHILGVYRSIGSVHLPRRLGNLEIAEQVPPRLLRSVAVAIALILGVATALGFADLGDVVGRYRATVAVGLVEPVLQRDASFYLSRLPLLALLHLAVMVAVVIGTTLVLGLYLLTGNITLSGRRVRLTNHARTHLIVLLATLALALAWGFHLDAYELIGGGGRLGGALAPVDRAIRLPASNALALIALVAAALSAVSLRWMKPALLLGVWGTMLVAALLGRLVVPLLAETWRAADTQVLTRTLAQNADIWSRHGVGILDVRSHPFPGGAALAPESAAALSRALEEVSPWSGEPGLLEAALEADESADSLLPRAWGVTLAAARGRDGRTRMVAIGVPQLDALAIARRSPRPRWSAVHRGAGAWAGAPVAVDAGMHAGPLRYFTTFDLADSSASRVTLADATLPVRFVPRTADLGIVPPDEVSVTEEPPGVRLHGFARRLLLAWALQTPPLMGEQTSQADRVLYWRDLPARLARLFPFAVFDAPRAVVAGGRLTWTVDGYLASARFPLARQVRWHGESLNFLSAAYLVTVDAASGRTRLFLRGPHAAFAAAMARAAHAEPLPGDSLDAQVRGHLAYPAGLFIAQAAVLARLGEGAGRWMLDARDTTAGPPDAATARPAAAVLDLDGAGRRLWWISAMAEQDGRGLGAVFAASATGLATRMVLWRFEDAALPSPVAAAARLSGLPDIVPGGTDGASVRRGPVLVIPAAGTVAFAQSIFATPDRRRVPYAMEAVAVLAGGRVAVGRDAIGAVRSLLMTGASPQAAAQLDASLAEARAAFRSLDSARAAGDWEAFGRAWQQLRRTLGLPEERP